MGFLAALETNGTNPGMVEKLIRDGLVDYIAMDIKAPLEEGKYMKAAGSGSGAMSRELFRNVLKTIKIIMDSRVDYEFRTTVVPGIHSPGDIEAIADSIKGARKYVLQQFLPENATEPELRKATPFPEKILKEIRRKIGKNFQTCEVRGIQ